MHEAALAIAALCPRVRCLGRRLRPFSIGHRLLLDWLENPLAARQPDEEPPHTAQLMPGPLMEAVWICSRPWRWQRHLRVPRHRLWRLWLRLRRTNWAREQHRFTAYLLDGSLFFPAHAPRGGAAELRLLGTPDLLRLYRLVCGLPEAEWRQWGGSVWDFPYGLAAMLYQARQEEDGAVEIYNAHDKLHDDFVARMEAEAAANGAN